MFLAGITAATLLWADLANVYVWVVLLVTWSFGLLGLMDDYAKVTKQTTAGISGRLRLVVEASIGLVAVLLMVLFAPHSPEGADISRPRSSSRSSSERWSICGGSTSRSARS